MAWIMIGSLSERGIRARHEAALLYSIDLIIWDSVKVFAVEKAA
jgi:hypothetical protein